MLLEVMKVLESLKIPELSEKGRKAGEESEREVGRLGKVEV